MLLKEIAALVNAGYTKAEIDAMTVEETQEATETEETKAEEPEEIQAEEPEETKATEDYKSIADLIISEIQKANVLNSQQPPEKTVSPEDILATVLPMKIETKEK